MSHSITSSAFVPVDVGKNVNWFARRIEWFWNNGVADMNGNMWESFSILDGSNGSGTAR